MGLKLDAQFPVKMPTETRDALQRIAAEKKVEPAELLRRAAYAIIEFASLKGDKAVPLDMAIGSANDAGFVGVGEKKAHYDTGATSGISVKSVVPPGEKSGAKPPRVKK